MAKKKAAAKAPQEDVMSSIIGLQRLQESSVQVPVIGITPLIPHKWSEKAKGMMRDKQLSGSVQQVKQRVAKNPEEDAVASCYWLNDEPAMPATAFKAATVGGCRFYSKGVTMAIAKQLLYVVGEGPEQLVQVVGEPKMREDTPRNSGGTADLRYRMQIFPWSAVLEIRFVPSMIDIASIIALVDAGGRGGVGDWRPSSPKSATGTFGQYRVQGEE